MTLLVFNNTYITNITDGGNRLIPKLEKNACLPSQFSKDLGLSLWQRLVLRINGHVFLRYEKREGWKEYLPIYLVRCKTHGILFEDYPQGYSNCFDCPGCMKGDALENDGESKKQSLP